MRRILATLAVAGWSGLAVAAGDDWQPLDGDGIRATLTGRSLVYDGAWQDFRESGRTLYNAGRDSWGHWDVRGDRYCSLWPPQDVWACYAVDLSADGASVRFRGAGGDMTVGRFRDVP